MKEEIILRKDKEWSLIDSELCLVTDFLPLMESTVKDGIAISPVTTMPYASISVECKRIKEKITGFITHREDFINLWHVFKEISLNEDKEEVLIYWTTKHYNNVIAKIISGTMLTMLGATPFPKIFVMLFKKGAYEKTADFKLPLKGNAQVFIYGLLPINCWVPKIMKENLK